MSPRKAQKHFKRILRSKLAEQNTVIFEELISALNVGVENCAHKYIEAVKFQQDKGKSLVESVDFIGDQIAVGSVKHRELYPERKINRSGLIAAMIIGNKQLTIGSRDLPPVKKLNQLLPI